MGAESTGTAIPRSVGDRYSLDARIGSGGMARVYLGRDLRSEGAVRPVAIKRLHPWLSKDPDFAGTVVDEGRVVSHIAHPNVVALHEVLVHQREIFLVLEYVHGESLHALTQLVVERSGRVPLPVAAALARDLLRGLHAAHEARDEAGRPLGIVHRDVSPQNLLVGVDGRAHLLDFGVAKAAGRMQSTRKGTVKGKLSYMAPEQLRGGLVSRKSDVFAASVVLWEMLTAQRLFDSKNESTLLADRTQKRPAAPSSLAPDVPRSLDALVARGLSVEPPERFPTADEMANALEASAPIAGAQAVSSWLASVGAPGLARRTRVLARIGAAPAGLVSTAGDRWWRPLVGWLRG